MGWYRVIMTLALLPFIHAIVFLVTNWFAAAYKAKSRTLQWLNLFFCISYLAIYLFLPDFGDIGEAYFFFGLIQSNHITSIAGNIAIYALIVHILLFILQIIQIFQIKKQDTACGHNDSL